MKQHQWTAWFFLKALAIIYAGAFLSVYVQAQGLFSGSGLIPVQEFLNYVKEVLGAGAAVKLPTLLWLSPSADAIQVLCLVGVVSSSFLFLGILPAVFCLLNWMLYLSIVLVGQSFFAFQWDILLLEAGFLSLFLAPWTHFNYLFPVQEPFKVVVVLFRLLYFKLLFMSGLSKLMAGADSPWRALTALSSHFETQPLPTFISYYAHHFPEGFLKFATLVVLFIEVVLPFLIFLGRKPRLVAFYIFSFFQLSIIVTGNYGFFNWLTLALGLLLVDDQFFVGSWPPRWLARKRWFDILPSKPGFVKKPIVAFFALFYLLLQVDISARFFAIRDQVPQLFFTLNQSVEQFYFASGYGLFSHMTKERIEINIEASKDNRNWKEYEFVYKPVSSKQMPGYTFLHMPRLDWMMWFAALRPNQNPAWLQRLIIGLKNGEPKVLALFSTVPYSRPNYLRTQVYSYSYTSLGHRQNTGQWWRREAR